MPIDLRGDAAMFLNVDEFAEKIEVHPASGRQRVISAIVDRNPIQQTGEAPNVSTLNVLITVANDPLEGIWSREVDLATWKVKLAIKDGGTPELRPLGKIMPGRQDAGMVTYEVL